MIAQPMKTTRSSILVVNLVCSGQPTQSLKFLPGDLYYLKRGIERCNLGVTARHHGRVLEFRWRTIS
jgi:hypothetical protein